MAILDEDTLAIVVSYLTASDARSLSATARQFHPVARRKVLATLELKEPKRAHGNLDFRLADGPNRAYWLRELKVNISNLNAIIELAPKLARLFEHAHILRSIYLSSAEAWIYTEPHPLEQLEGVDDLELYGYDHRTLGMIQRMASKPRRLVLREQQPRFNSIATTTTRVDFTHIMQSLAPQQALRTLTLEMGGGVAGARLPDVGTQWPSVTHLDLSARVDNAPDLDELVHMFPRLRSIRFRAPNVPSYALSHSPGPSRTCWEVLDYVHGTIVQMRFWSVACPVHHLNTWIYIPLRDGSSTEHRVALSAEPTLEVLRRTSPVVLTVDRYTAIRNFGTDEDQWRGVLEATPRLRVLTMALTNFTLSGVEEWLEKVVNVLSRSRLLCMLLWLGDDEDHSPDAVATRIADVIPSMRYIVLTRKPLNKLQEDLQHPSQFCGTTEWKWWRVVDTEGRRSLESVSFDVGVRVATYLYSPEYDCNSTFKDPWFR